MHITVKERFRPFSHEPGTLCMVPGTTAVVEVFPALLRIFDISQRTPLPIEERVINVTGPVKGFTVQMDIEKQCVRVWGTGADGFMSYRIQADPLSGRANIVGPEETYPENHWEDAERLSLGVHKHQDWTLVQRRLNPAEILPFWYQLGIVTPGTHEPVDKTAPSLLRRCTKEIESGLPYLLCRRFLDLFQAGFSGILSPRVFDSHFQGFTRPPISEHNHPLTILKEGASLIRTLFFRTEEKRAWILPALPPEIHCGRFINLQFPPCGIVDIEWTKKRLRRLVVHSQTDSPIKFTFPSELKSYRLRCGSKERGRSLSVSDPIQMEKGMSYYFDNFQK